MAKLKLDGTSPNPSPYSDFTSKYRTSQMIEDRRDMTKSEQPSRTPTSYSGGDIGSMRADAKGRSPRTNGSGYDGNTPDDYSTQDIGGQASPTTPGSGFPSVTSNQQKANYAPQMEEYINNSKRK